MSSDKDNPNPVSVSLNNDKEKNETESSSQNKKSSKLSKSILKNLGKKFFLPIITSNNSVLTNIHKKKEEKGPIFQFYSMQKKIQRPKANKSNKNVQSYIKIYELEKQNEDTQDFNVFNQQDKVIKDLMMQFYEKQKKKNVSKLNKRKNALNKLYDISPQFNNKIIEAKKFKSLNLEDYQKNILSSIPAKSIGQAEIMDLVQNLKNLKSECDSVKPLPPINIKIIEEHVHNKNNSKSTKKMNLREYLKQTNEPKDDFEKEEREIKNLRSYRSLKKSKRNKNFDFLPAYFRESLNNNLKFHL